MKKFFKFGKKKESGGLTPAGSKGNLSKASSELSLNGQSATGYTLKEKDLTKLHKAAWNGDLAKVRQLAKKDPSALDKENRSVTFALSIVLFGWKLNDNIFSQIETFQC